MHSTLVVCIPTYNRASVIKDVLDTELPIFEKYHIDVVLYDSSEGRETEEIWFSYRRQGATNLYYKRVACDIPSNQKVYQIYQEMENSNYDYVWVIHDHKICSQSTIERICEALTQNKDFYIISKMEGTQYRNSDITDKNVFLKKYAGLLTMFGASIISIKRFVHGTNWKALEEKYLTKENMNLSHIGFYFERASEIEDLSVMLLEFPIGSFRTSKEKKGCSWYRDTIRIWTECWASTILKLPDTYCDKIEAIRSIEKIHMTKRDFITYKRDGFYDFKVFRKYRKWIKIVSSTPLFHYLFIAVTDPDFAFGLYKRKLIKKIRKKQNRTKELVIYGAGLYATECAGFMKENHLDFEAFIVSSMKNNPLTLLEHPVVEAKEFFEKNCDVVIIVAVSDMLKSKIYEYLQDMHMEKNAIFFEF